MNFTAFIENIFRKYVPSPFTIAVLLTLLTILLAFISMPEHDADGFIQVLRFWEAGVWNNSLLVFGYQMMLILVLGHILVLSKPMSRLISLLVERVKDTGSAVVLVSISTMLVSFFNWGLGLIFGAIIARKVGEYAQKENIPINYPLVGAAGYVGLMIWHGGLSGSAPLKVAEEGHLKDIMSGAEPELLSQLPTQIGTYETIFSWWNLMLFGVLLMVIPIVLKYLAIKTKPKKTYLKTYKLRTNEKLKGNGAEQLEFSPWVALLFGVIILLAFIARYWQSLSQLNITPNMLNFFMLGLGILLHGNFHSFLKALNEAIKDTSGILIQFPLYFGIMGLMSESGMITQISDFFVSVANDLTLPVLTFVSGGLVNIFVPSGGGQWAVQGPVVLESALKLGVPLPKAIMALAYGDQITNMLQPFWALPLLAITKLKAKEILPYTLILMLVGSVVYLTGLLLL
ncbi:short-chain fatty acid transporter [Zhouia amylolytica]|uniref:short-chain fatty acid transporter n=1 Tax=Zhouia amylolytica TaxID=376730 RepID=UPI0020CCE03C|nr:TIGR00366 family protein [Zhouia amylolytica]MCQ0111593.1 short-chain fatty acid transporter [Zhouia amylolytica]